MGLHLPFERPTPFARSIPLAEGIPHQAVALWAIGAGLYVGGDLITTVLGFHAAAVTEANPLVTRLFLEFGVAGMLLPKLAILAIGVGLWSTMRERYRATVPVVLSINGAAITAWNLFVLFGPIG